jgi:hypothetical protein
MRISPWLSVVALITLPSAEALACSPPRCWEPALWPASGSVPANMVTLSFRPGRESGAPGMDASVAAPRLFRIEGETRVSVPFTSSPQPGGNLLWLTPVETQPVGARLVLEADPTSCEDTAFRAELVVSEPVPLPTTVGALEARVKREALGISVINGSCDALVDASFADLEVQLSEAARPYAGLFRHQLFVDGAPVGPFYSSLRDGETPPQGQARIFAICAQEGWVSPSAGGAVGVGKHRVRMKSELPDGTALETPEVEVELRCDGAPPTWPADAGRPPSTRADAGSQDAGVINPIMSDASLINTPVLRDEDDDDGCALAARGDGAWLLALALFLLRRRTR